MGKSGLPVAAVCHGTTSGRLPDQQLDDVQHCAGHPRPEGGAVVVQ